MRTALIIVLVVCAFRVLRDLLWLLGDVDILGVLPYDLRRVTATFIASAFDIALAYFFYQLLLMYRRDRSRAMPAPAVPTDGGDERAS
jgi:hypothetical protein